MAETKETNDRTEHKKLTEKVKKMLVANVDEHSEKLALIDAIQRLGMSYHFESEIDQILTDLYNTQLDSDGGDNDNELYKISLNFRLSCDVFKKLKDGQGNFKVSLIHDARGMLSTFEATHLRVHGEDILDEALAFTISHLEQLSKHVSSPLAAQITHALKQPIRKGLPRLEARPYLSIY